MKNAFKMLLNRIIKTQTLSEENRAKAFSELAVCERIDIVTRPHTLYVAKSLQKHLKDMGIKSNIYRHVPISRLKDIFIVICPQVFALLPVRYIAFQMEQTVSSRWLTEEYYKILENAVAVFDYSKRNIAFFNDSSFASRLFYVPIDYCDFGKEYRPPKYDVLFYGDTRCERRKKYLEEIAKHFNVKILFKVYQDAALEEISQAKIVVNIHYYEEALLESTRIYEVLSLNNSIVVSEKGIDNEDYELDEVVDFVDIGDIDAMVSRINHWLDNDCARKEKLFYNKQVLCTRKNSTAIGLRNFLLSVGRS